MTLSEIRDILNAQVLSNNGLFDRDISRVVASDLMSDVLTFADDGSLLLTGLVNTQVIRTCEITGINGIVFVRGKTPQADTIALSEKCQIPVMATPLTMFEACGLLYARGLRPSSEKK